MIGNVQEFIMDAFDYPTELINASLDCSANRYLLEYIANGYVKYGSTANFINNIDKWIHSLARIYPELGFDNESHQIMATIDLVDQVVVLDDALAELLEYIIRVQQKYGLIIKYTTPNGTSQTTLMRFFETIEKFYPQIKDRFKGLGSSPAKASREVITDPKTRRINRVTINDINTMRQMGILVGKSNEEVKQRKELLMNFKFTSADIDT